MWNAEGELERELAMAMDGNKNGTRAGLRITRKILWIELGGNAGKGESANTIGLRVRQIFGSKELFFGDCPLDDNEVVVQDMIEQLAPRHTQQPAQQMIDGNAQPPYTLQTTRAWRPCKAGSKYLPSLPRGRCTRTTRWISRKERAGTARVQDGPDDEAV